MPPAIRAALIGKQYRLGTREPYGSLRDVLARVMTAPFKRRLAARPERTRVEPLWALRDVSFEVQRAEIVGLVGRNGSGKSTLLKILSRITAPTTGRAEVHGRVGSLLEVGTGFHPELSGRENIFVNGAILGMGRREIAKKFDEIVAFAEVERFVDTPVKHYSSGMHMRLAFAVAAHLQPDVLLVDEVLAVGDAEFQRRCLGKMEDVSREGRTVIFVSHQMGQIRRLCGRVIWLDQGRIQQDSEAGAGIVAYEAATLKTGATAPGRCFTAWEILGHGHRLRDGRRAFTIRVRVHLAEALERGHFGLGILDDKDAVVAGWAFEPIDLAPGDHALDVTIECLPVRPGTYRVSLALFAGGNNLTGGTLLEKWIAAPPLVLDVAPVAHPQDAWAGILNVPAVLSSEDGVEVAEVGAVAGRT